MSGSSHPGCSMGCRPTRSAWVLVAAVAALGAAAASDTIVVAAFSSGRPGGALPPGWETLKLANVSRHTAYKLVEDEGVTVLEAESRGAAAGITRKLRADPAEYPILRWRWKVANLLETSDLRTKAGDDYPARVYVMFDYPADALPFSERIELFMARLLHGSELPAATLCYVWDAKAPAGTIAPSAYTRRVRMIVAESGPARVNQWVKIERDLAADFRAAFGAEPAAVNAVAIATDTDNTGESATAWYGDISLHRRAAPGRGDVPPAPPSVN